MSSQRGAQLMSELLPEPTPLRLTGPPGSLRPSRDGGGRSADSAESRTDFKQLLMLLRRRIGLVAGVAALIGFVVARSGEGRVGEEGRFWGSPDHLKKKKANREE